MNLSELFHLISQLIIYTRTQLVLKKEEKTKRKRKDPVTNVKENA